MATKVTNKRGKTVYLEDPSERANRYAIELKRGEKLASGKKLTDAQAGFRMGVLYERKTSAKIYNRKNGLIGKGRSKIKYK